jgi:acyl carrier protein
VQSTPLVTDTGGTRDLIRPERITLRDDVMHEVCRQLTPYRVEETPISARTVIYKDLSIDSLAVMDIILELEDRFDVSIPINTIAEIHTVQEMVDAILKLRAVG